MTDERDERDERARQADVLRDTAVRSLVANLVSLGLTLGVMVAISKRDHLARLGMRVHRQLHGRQDAATAAQDIAVRHFQRELHDVLRGTPGPVTVESRGLYG